MSRQQPFFARLLVPQQDSTKYCLFRLPFAGKRIPVRGFRNTVIVCTNDMLYSLAMHRALLSGLLLVCLGVFLCPAVGKPGVLSAPRQESCCKQTSGCVKSSNRVEKTGGCASEKSQPARCCPLPYSALILFCAAVEALPAPHCADYSFFAAGPSAFSRIDRPPVPPPRA